MSPDRFAIIGAKYHGPTNRNGSRVKAVLLGGWQARLNAAVSVSYDHGVEAAEAHRHAARVLVEKMNADETGWTFTLCPDASMGINQAQRGNPLNGWSYLFRVKVEEVAR